MDRAMTINSTYSTILATERMKLDMMPSMLERLNARFRIRMICFTRKKPISKNSMAKIRDGSLSRIGWKILFSMPEVCFTSSPTVSTMFCTAGARFVVSVATAEEAVQKAEHIRIGFMYISSCHVDISNIIAFFRKKVKGIIAGFRNMLFLLQCSLNILERTVDRIHFFW